MAFHSLMPSPFQNPCADCPVLLRQTVQPGEEFGQRISVRTADAQDESRRLPFAGQPLSPHLILPCLWRSISLHRPPRPRGPAPPGAGGALRDPPHAAACRAHPGGSDVSAVLRVRGRSTALTSGLGWGARRQTLGCVGSGWLMMLI